MIKKRVRKIREGYVPPPILKMGTSGENKEKKQNISFDDPRLVRQRAAKAKKYALPRNILKGFELLNHVGGVFDGSHDVFGSYRPPTIKTGYKGGRGGGGGGGSLDVDLVKDREGEERKRGRRGKPFLYIDPDVSDKTASDDLITFTHLPRENPFYKPFDFSRGEREKKIKFINKVIQGYKTRDRLLPDDDHFEYDAMQDYRDEQGEY